MPNPRYRTTARTSVAVAANPQNDPNPANSHNLTRHGGPVLRTTTNYLIWWTPSGGPQLSSYYQAIVRRFFKDVSGSDLYKAMTQYDGGNGAITTQATLGGEWTDASAYGNGLGTVQNPLQDQDIRDEIDRALSANPSWQLGDDHVIYYIFLASGAQECNTTFSTPECTFFNDNPPFKGNGAFCAYHESYFAFNHLNGINYAVMPEVASLGGCSLVGGPFGSPAGSPNFDAEADAEVSVLSHEYFESITNAHGDAWYDDSPGTDPTIFNGFEIGDKCNAMAGPQSADLSDVHLNGNPYLIQMEWSNSAHNCAIPGADNGALRTLAACTSNTLPANDDGSTGQLTLPFTANFFGQAFTSLWANNNGNVTFDGPQYIYTPYPLTTTNHSIIAPFFADVDTRGDHSGLLTYGSAAASGGTPAYFCANWINVGYFPLAVDKLNSFQLIMFDRSGDPGGKPGDFDIIFNYDKITWETGSASGGQGGLGGSSARVGYSNGVNRALELPGSAINGALLDGGSNSLVQGSANSTVRGRYIYPVRNGAAPTGGTLQGTVRDDTTTTNPVAGASIQVCDSTGACHLTNTNGAGMYTVAALPDGTYTVTVSPPAGGLAQATVGPFNLVNAATVQADVQLHSVIRIPSDTTVSHHSINPDGTLVLDGRVSNTLTTHGCPDGGADVTITATNSQTHVQETRSYSLTETPLSSGTYMGSIPAVSPLFGAATVTVSIACPPPTRGRTFSFSIYIDPSGIVVDQAGNPVAGATVTLLRSDSISGPFTPVPAGDTVMSPANRNNPDLTTADGRFGWDVLTGYYTVQASRDGCTAPGNPAQTVVQSAVFPVPPPVTNLTLTLSCQITTSTALSSSANPAAYGTLITFTATVTATNTGLPNPTTGDGSVSFKDGGSLLCNAVALGGNQASCSVSLSVGTHPIQATYSGTTRFVGGAAALTEQVNPAPTTTALASTPNPSFVNRPVTLTATVISAAPGGANPTSEGSVSFLLGTTTLGSAPLDASGSASMVTSGLPIGHDSLTAVYSGDANFTGSTSPPLVQAVRNNRIVFSSNRDGNYEIYAMNPDGTGQVRLTNNPAVDTNPAFSPDGTRIAFVSNRTSGWQVWVMNADGTNPKQVTSAGSDANVTPSWSPDGQRIAYSSTQRSGSLQIWVVNADGTNPKRLTTDPATDTSPAWSPSGSQIAFSSTLSGTPQIWVMNADGTNVRRLTNDTGFDVTPAWAPDGSRLAFAMGQRNHSAAIYLVNTDGSNVVRLTNNGLATDAIPSWSPDGSQVAFTTTISNQVEIYSIKVDGTTQTRLTVGPPINALPEWCCTQAP